MGDAIDKAIAALSRPHHGYVTRRQLVQLGLSRWQIEYRIQVGRLIPVYHGIYAVGHLPATPLDRAAGAILACGPNAALSNISAATLWGWHKHWQMPFHVTTPSNHSRQGIVVHRAKLGRRDLRTQLGLRATSPARTILDVAPTLDIKQRKRMVNDALHGYLRLSDLADVLARFPRHPGAKLLHRYVETSNGPSRSDFEDDFQAFCAEHGLPQPLINVRVHGYEVDAWFPDHRLVVELDSWEFHRGRDTFESDRDKDANLLSQGIETVRITWERLGDAPEREAARLRAILRDRADKAA